MEHLSRFGDCGPFVGRLHRAKVLAALAKVIDVLARHQSSQAGLPPRGTGMPGFSIQLGRTSTRLPQHLLHFIRNPKDGTSISSWYSLALNTV